ncbi:MAG: DUF4214 domain-containing protein [Pseudomonadota bacterium]
MKTTWFLLGTLCLISIGGLLSPSFAAELTLVPKTPAVFESEAFSVDIVVDDAEGVAGCSVTLTYPSSVLELASSPVTTTFFNAFVDNRAEADPSSIDPWRENSSNTGQIIFSGAYIDTNSSTGGGGAYTGKKTLFTVHFKVKPNASLGNYFFELQQTMLCNGPAGWGTDVNNNGQWDTGDTYEGAPILIKAYGKNTSRWDTSEAIEIQLNGFTSNPTVTFKVVCLDTDADSLCDDLDDDDDNDGLPDSIELVSGTNSKNADTDGDMIKDGEEDANHNGEVDPGETDPNDPSDGIATISTTQFIQGIYVAYWLRAADPDGLDYWQGLYDSGTLYYAGIAENFAASGEGTEAYEYFDTVFYHPEEDVTDAMREEFIRIIYQNLFDRAPDSEGLAYWMDVLKRGLTSPGAFIATIINASYEGRQGVSATDWRNLAVKIIIAEYYTDQCDKLGIVWTVEENMEQARDILGGVTGDSDIADRKKAVDEELTGATAF